MPKFVIERSVVGASRMSAQELKDTSSKSVSVLRDLGPDIQWVHSYVAGDKIYCIYNARDEDLIREHARCGGFPVDSVSRVYTVIDPTTAES